MKSTVWRISGASARGAAWAFAGAVAASAAAGACAKNDDGDAGSGGAAATTTTGGAGGGGGATTSTSSAWTGSTGTTTSTSSAPCGGGCADGLACCDDPSSGAPACIDTQANRFHGGGCGKACTGADYCVAGACVTPGDAGACDPPPTCSPACAGGAVCSVDPGTCKAACCAPPSVFCGGACILPSDNANCGACGTVCPEDAACGADANGTISCAPITCGPGTAACHHGCLPVAEDPKNCGACGNACPPDTACGAGVCCQPFAAIAPTVLHAGLQAGAGAIGLGASMVLYRELASLYGVPTKGGAVVTVADPGDDPKIGTSGAFGWTPTTVTWANIDGVAYEKTIGAGVKKLIEDPALLSVSRVAADATGVYFASLFEQTIWRPGKSAAECPDPLVPLCARVVVKAGGPVAAIALTPDHVYYVAKGLYRVNRAGNPVPALVVDESLLDGDTRRLAVAGDSILWGNLQVAKGRVAVGAAKLDGSSPRVLFRSGDDVPLDVTGLTGDATWAYFASTGTQATIRRVPVGGGCPDVIVKLTKSADLVSDATRLYFVDQTASASLETIAKP